MRVPAIVVSFVALLFSLPALALNRSAFVSISAFQSAAASPGMFANVGCYYTTTATCAGGGDFDRGASGCTDDGVLKIKVTSTGECYYRDNFGLNGVIDARQCGLHGDGVTDDDTYLQKCLNLAGALGYPVVVNSGGGVVVDNTADIVIPANVELTCGGSNASDLSGDDYRIKNNAGNVQLTNAIVLDPRYKISMPSSGGPNSKNSTFTGCTLEAGVGGSGIAYPNIYSPSVWYPDCKPDGTDCTGSTPYLRSAIYEQNAFYHDPSWNCSSGQDPNHRAGCSTGIDIGADHVTVRDVTVLGFATCYRLDTGVRPNIEHLQGDCDTGLNFTMSNSPKLNDFRIAPLLTGGAETSRAFHIESIAAASGHWQVVARIVNPSNGDDPNFVLADGDTVWIAPATGYESAIGRWTISGTSTGTCTGGGTCQTFTLTGSIATGISEEATVNNVLTDGAPPTEVTGIDPPADSNPDFQYVHVGQAVSDSAACLPSGTTVAAMWPARGIVYVSKSPTCTATRASHETLTFQDNTPGTFPACSGAPVPPSDDPAGCVSINSAFRFGDGIRVENVGGVSAFNCSVFEHQVAFHMYSRANNGRWANCAAGDNNALPDSGIISLLIDGSHQVGETTPNDACDISFANGVLGQHRTVAVLVQSDCSTPNLLSNITMGVPSNQELGIGLEVDAGAVSLVNGTASNAANVLKAQHADLYDSTGSKETGSPFPASLNISNNSLSGMTLYIENGKAGASTAGCGNFFAEPTPFLCAPSSFIQPPGGRLALCGTPPCAPVMTADVVAATHVYYVPYTGQQVPVYNTATAAFGLSDIATAGLTLDLDAMTHHTSANLYDIFAEIDPTSDGIELCSGPAWSKVSAPYARSTSGQVAQVNGIWVNSTKMDCYFSSGGTSGTRDCLVSECTYLGTFYTTADGQTAQQFGPVSGSGGGAPCLCLYNAYNHVALTSMSVDTHAAYIYNTSTWRYMDASAANGVTVVDGLAQMQISAQLVDALSNGASSGTFRMAAIGINALPPGAGISAPTPTVRASSTTQGSYGSTVTFVPIIGLWTVHAVESAVGGTTGNATFGGNALQEISVQVED
jgi:hypothetical protein